MMEGLRIQVAVPYRLRPQPRRESSTLVFREPVRHQVVTLYTLAVMCIVLSLGGIVGVLTGYPKRILTILAIVVLAAFSVACVTRARKLKSREFFVDPAGGECTIRGGGGKPVHAFRLEDTELRIVRISHPADRDPWGFGVVLVAPRATFPLAAVEKREQAEQYISELPDPLRERFIDEETSAHVPRLWPRGWS